MEHSQFTQQNSAKGSADYFTGDVTIKSGFTLREGDVVWFAPDEKHWHGASPHSPMAHIAILEEKDGVGTIWLEQVSEADFTAAP